MQQDAPRKKALVIAISNYRYFDKLPFCENDGKEMIQTLQRMGFDIPESRQLVGTVGYKKIDNAIKEFFRGNDVKSTDILLFYYSGHATPFGDGGDHYFVTTETKMEEADLTGFDYDELRKLSSNSRSQQIIKIVDCCYSGALDAKGTAQAQALVGRRNIEEKSAYEGKGSYLLASSLATQESYPNKDKPYSEFTYHIIQGLNGVSEKTVDVNGHVTPHTLGIYVASKMSDSPKDQRPIIKTEGSGEISLADYHQKFPNKMPQFTQSIEERLVSLFKEEKIEEYQNLKKQNPERFLDLDGVVFPKNVDLRGIDLNYASLEGADLSGVNLSEATFVNANMTNAKIIGADLSGADLQFTKLINCRLDKTNLTGVRNLSSAIHTGATFQGAKLNNLELNGMNFSDLDLENVELSEAKLENAIMRKTNLKNAKLVKAHLTGIFLEGANLEHADLSGAEGNYMHLSGANLFNANLEGAIIPWSDMECVDLSEADLRNTELTNCHLGDAYFIKSKLEKTKLDNADLSFACFIDTDLTSTDLSNAIMTRAKIIRTRLNKDAKYLKQFKIDSVDSNQKYTVVEISQ